MPFLSTKPQHFGSLLLTSVSDMHGFTEVYPSFTNIISQITTVVLCSPKERAIFESCHIKIGKIMNMLITFDRRQLDGARATKMFGHPESFELILRRYR